MPPVLIQSRNYKTGQITVVSGLVSLCLVNLNITSPYKNNDLREKILTIAVVTDLYL